MKQLIEDLISAMEYHVEQTRPIHSTTVALQAAREVLKAMPTHLACDCYQGQVCHVCDPITPLAQPAPVQEPVGWWDDKLGFFEEKHFDQLRPLYTTPPAQPAPAPEGRDWSLLEATQESLREHMAEIKRLKAAQPAVPDAMTSADIQEHIEYVAGWNDCRQAMLEMMK